MKIETWQILDVGSIWMREFASALAETQPCTSWWPVMSLRGAWQRYERVEVQADPPLRLLRYPLQRGYHRALFRRIAPFERPLLKRMRAHCDDPAATALICSTPFYAPVAEAWPGPVVYYVTDLTAEYDGIDARQVQALDRRMCAVARAVCPNSRRIAAYLEGAAACPPEKITVVPNATRATNVAPHPLLVPGVAPSAIAHLRRPLAGVIGNLAGNMDWVLLQEVVRRTPQMQWVFVGPTSMAIDEAEQARARSAVMSMAHFTGPQPYGSLQAFARSFDVAVLPYRKKEPTYSGSSTRFYEHLAACRPMVATCGFAELLEKPPLLRLAMTAGEMVEALEDLHRQQFTDGYETARWEASREGTWQARAGSIVGCLQRLP